MKGPPLYPDRPVHKNDIYVAAMETLYDLARERPWVLGHPWHLGVSYEARDPNAEMQLLGHGYRIRMDEYRQRGYQQEHHYARYYAQVAAHQLFRLAERQCPPTCAWRPGMWVPAGVTINR